jgi:hypothetical protein
MRRPFVWTIFVSLHAVHAVVWVSFEAVQLRSIFGSAKLPHHRNNELYVWYPKKTIGAGTSFGDVLRVQSSCNHVHLIVT